MLKKTDGIIITIQT